MPLRPSFARQVARARGLALGLGLAGLCASLEAGCGQDEPSAAAPAQYTSSPPPPLPVGPATAAPLVRNLPASAPVPAAPGAIADPFAALQALALAGQQLTQVGGPVVNWRE